MYKDYREYLYLCAMSTYKEQQEGKTYFVLIQGGVPIGTFGSLKKVCDFMEGKDFPSYWTLVRKELPIIVGRHEIYKVPHT